MHDINTISKQQPMTSTPASKPIQLKKEGLKDKVIEYILESRYPAAFKLLLKKSRCARDGLIHTLKAIIRREVKCAEVCSLQESLSLDSLSASFPMATCSERHFSRVTCIDRSVRKCTFMPQK